MEYRLRRHDGEYRWVLDEGVPLFSPDGSFAGYIGSCIDITERRHAEDAFVAREWSYASRSAWRVSEAGGGIRIPIRSNGPKSSITSPAGIHSWGAVSYKDHGTLFPQKAGCSCSAGRRGACTGAVQVRCRDDSCGSHAHLGHGAW